MNRSIHTINSNSSIFAVGFFACLIKNSVISFILGIPAFLYYKDQENGFSICIKIFAALLFISIIVDILRNFLLPVAISTTGGFFSILKTMIYWCIGPQIKVILFILLVAAFIICYQKEVEKERQIATLPTREKIEDTPRITTSTKIDEPKELIYRD